MTSAFARRWWDLTSKLRELIRAITGGGVTPLGGVVLGLVLLIFDFRVGGLDLVPDVASWVLIAVSLGKLAGRTQAFGLAKSAAVVTAVLSLADLVHPIRTTTTVEGMTEISHTGAAQPVGLQGAVFFAYTIATVVIPVLICWAVRSAALSVRDLPTATSFTNLVVAVVVVSTLAFGYLAGFRNSGFGGGLVLLAIAGLVVFVWTLVALYRVRELDYLTPTG